MAPADASGPPVTGTALALPRAGRDLARLGQGRAPVRTAAGGRPLCGAPYSTGAAVHAAGYSGDGGQLKGGLGDTMHGAGVQNP